MAIVLTSLAPHPQSPAVCFMFSCSAFAVLEIFFFTDPWYKMDEPQKYAK